MTVRIYCNNSDKVFVFLNVSRSGCSFIKQSVQSHTSFSLTNGGDEYIFNVKNICVVKFENHGQK